MDLKLLIILTLIFALPICIYFIRRYYLRQLRDEVTRAQKSEQIKSVFLANVSHALRTPLNAVIGFIAMIFFMRLDYHNFKNLKIPVIQKLNMAFMIIIKN